MQFNRIHSYCSKLRRLHSIFQIYPSKQQVKYGNSYYCKYVFGCTSSPSLLFYQYKYISFFIFLLDENFINTKEKVPKSQRLKSATQIIYLPWPQGKRPHFTNAFRIMKFSVVELYNTHAAYYSTIRTHSAQAQAYED